MIAKQGGTQLTNKYKDISNILSSVYKDYKWCPWKFKTVKSGYWKDINNQIEYVNWLGEELNIKSHDDWYKVTAGNIIDNYGATLLQYYNNSHINLFKNIFKDVNWLPWKFSKTTRGYWKDIKNQRTYMEWLSKQLNINKYEDWYTVGIKQFIENYGNTILKYYNYSPYALMTTIYPDYEWLPWKFLHAPTKYWNYIENQRKYMNWLGKQLNVNKYEDWYKISVSDIKEYRIWFLLFKYRCLSKALANLYPEFNWEFYKFNRTSSIVVSEIMNSENIDIQRNFLEMFKEAEGIVANEDLLLVTEQQIMKYIRKLKLGEFLKMVFKVYPDVVNNPVFVKRKTQNILKNYLYKLFPNSTIIENYHHSSLIYRNTRDNILIDFYITEHSIGFDYRGQHHYKQSKYFKYYDLEDVQHKDKLKADQCQKKGIKLIVIPYWWKLDIDSLATTIYNQCPQLFTTKPVGIPIPNEKQTKIQTTQRNIVL